MWDTIQNILNGDNALLVILFAVCILLLVAQLVKSGSIKIHSKNLSIGGTDEHERDIIRRQVEFAAQSVRAFENTMPKPEGYETYKGKYIFSLVNDEIVKWILFNHIENSESYISLKIGTVLNIIQSNTDIQYLHSNDFSVYVEVYVKELIKNLVAVRKSAK